MRLPLPGRSTAPAPSALDSISPYSNEYIANYTNIFAL